ncbi:unnamed protein product [Rotaria sp. Silwood2]|nr:unnamed protein product [Rotaria sp. Silwood2]CAF4339564.1 unnamed protein product [Rotaria sp. Silwood2]
MAVNVDHKKKRSFHFNHILHDKGNNMSASTKRHFESIKRKLFAFADNQSRMEFDGRNTPPPPPSPHPSHVSSHQHPQSLCVEQNRTPKQRSHHHYTPSLSHKILPQHQDQLLPLHQQLPHLALATPRLARRL